MGYFQGYFEQSHQRKQAAFASFFLVLQCALSCGCGPELFSETKLMIIKSGVPGLLWKEM